MESAQQLFRTRLLKGAVAEAANYPKMLCNQHCKTHIFIKNGMPYDQLTGERHDCIMTRIAKMFIAHYNMIRISQIKDCRLGFLSEILSHQEEWNRKWNLAFEDWKKSGRVPKSKEVEQYY